ncbi:hypothetical protein LKO27_13990 [Tessaracoccus sp. OS52]|uniref:hypothetical protein n=1 Tax=Tessaracoccus sp. OS52 TaxID=2886691 RepID=UPI001D127B23|nr:hypothetical protein [Tessaracoccus sp. OS52]MCC2594515.1 hypothetical protein [Tessaracoccus sp. OS52]
MADPLLLAPVALFVAATACATSLAASEDLRGEPFGLRVPGGVRAHLALGLGSAISAPWPMPALATWAAVRAAPGTRWAARTVAIVGACMWVGIASEPITWRRRPASRLAATLIPLHLAIGAAMVSAGLYRLLQPKLRPPQ